MNRIQQIDYKKLLHEWQDRLNMWDWIIQIIPNCKPDEMPLEDRAGCVEYTEECKAGQVLILDPQYYGDRIIPFDAEKTIVHELLHMKMALIADKDDALHCRTAHQLIDELACALVNAKRGEGGRYEQNSAD